MPLYNLRTMCVPSGKYASANADLEGKKKTEESPPVSLKSARKEDGASAIYSRDVTVGVSSSSGFTPLLRRAVKRWQEMFVFMYLTPTGVMEYMGV